MKNHIIYRCTVLLASIFLLSNCKDYLDVVPDGVATTEIAFSNRTNAEKFFFGCYNYLPNVADYFNYPGFLGGDEILWCINWVTFSNSNGARIAQGQQNSNYPYQDYWDGANGGKRMWVGIRDCNILLENIDRVSDMYDWEKARWKAEVKFLKAYFHFFLMQLYGPIPIMDKNIEVNAPLEEVWVYRDPVDDVVEFIVRTLNEAVPDLPLEVEVTAEMGRISKPIATALKAKVLVWAASPLFNGSAPFYQNFKDDRGVQLVTLDNRPEAIQARWQRAAIAVKNAIDTCHLAGHQLYRFMRGYQVMSDNTALKYTLRGAVCERPINNNREIIWPDVHNNVSFQNYCMPKIYSYSGYMADMGAHIKIAENYYTHKGIPIDEDPDWDYDARYETMINSDDIAIWHEDYIGRNETTAKLNFYREPRFYAHLGFDRGIYELLALQENELVIRNRVGEAHGMATYSDHIVGGYFIKKMVSIRNPVITSSPNPYRFSIPIIRLADLYLLYAEALNESKDTPDNEVYRWVDSIRYRAGLNGVVASWQLSSNQGKPAYKEGMREIIKRERIIELSFEGERPFDLRRWLDAEQYSNEPMRGWNYQGREIEDYYTVRTYISNRNFTYKDYLWPIRKSTLTVNDNLVQNPGW